MAAQQGSALHALVADECQRKAAAEAAALASAVALDSTAFLQHVVNLWEAYSSQLSLIRCATGRKPVWSMAVGPDMEHVYGSGHAFEALQAIERQPQTAGPPRCMVPCPWSAACCRQVFLYLDRAYVVNHPGTLSVFQLGLRQLRCQLEALPHVSKAGSCCMGCKACRRHVGSRPWLGCASLAGQLT